MCIATHRGSIPFRLRWTGPCEERAFERLHGCVFVLCWGCGSDCARVYTGELISREEAAELRLRGQHYYVRSIDFVTAIDGIKEVCTYAYMNAAPRIVASTTHQQHVYFVPQSRPRYSSSRTICHNVVVVLRLTLLWSVCRLCML